tara:strand:- start:15841 stop:16626 length:786 start_codon:yes stop_codon:yes gene_type:complete
MTVVPKIIFIVPYRDRKEHKQFFSKYMEFIMEDYNSDDYEIYFVEQCDKRLFNRGAMKNIGFLACKSKYPNDYHNITFVFNDVDTIPYTKNLLDYKTVKGNVKHFYGYEYALGGIFSIIGEDFEKTNGFPNLWGWSMEDNFMQSRVYQKKLIIDRSSFFKIGSKSILQFIDGLKKIINKKEIAHFLNNNYSYGLSDLTCLNFKFQNEFIKVFGFISETDPNQLTFQQHDITKPGATQIKLTKNELNQNNKSLLSKMLFSKK